MEPTERTLYLVDESQIEAANDAAILASAELQKHVEMINTSLDFIDRLLRAATDEGPDELIVKRLGVRCFNSGAAAVRLARSGYYNQCLSLVRDIIEITLLLDLFAREPNRISEWAHSTPTERDRKFGPVKVRLYLEKHDQADGRVPVRRDHIYKMFCTYGAHATPESFTLISPNNMTNIGPFPDADRVKAMIEEVVKHLTFGAVVFAMHLRGGPEIGQMKNEFYAAVDVWQKEFLGGK